MSSRRVRAGAVLSVACVCISVLAAGGTAASPFSSGALVAVRETQFVIDLTR